MLSNSNSEFLPPVQDNEFLPPISRWTTLGGLLLVGALGVALAGASAIKYKVTVKAQALIRPAGELRVVQAATEGTITRIFVAENQAVKKGDVIATIDDSRLQTQKKQLQGNIGQAQRQLVQINAQIRALNRQIGAETDRINRAVAISERELDRRRRNYRDSRIITAAEVSEAEAALNSAEAALNAARLKWERYRPIAEAGAISQEQLEEAQLAVEQQEQAIEIAKARRQRAQTALNPGDAGVAIASERIAQEKATGESTLAALNKEREALIGQLLQIQNQLERDTSELQQLEIDLSQTAITATADGIVSKLNLRNPGQTVRPGEEIAQIAPSNTPLIGKALVAAEDIGKVEIGQKVQLRISACPYPDYGTLKGFVRAISPDAIAPQDNGANAPTTASSQKAGAADAFYEVRIDPDSLFLGRGKNQCPIQLGMEGTAEIISTEETVLQFLLRKARLATDLGA